MAMDGISKTNGAPKATQTKKQNNTATAKANAKQQELANRIIEPARNVSDLKSNAKIKQQQIQLAMQSGDIDLANTLQKELNQIKADIERNETSIFDDKNKNKDK